MYGNVAGQSDEEDEQSTTRSTTHKSRAESISNKVGEPSTSSPSKSRSSVKLEEKIQLLTAEVTSTRILPSLSVKQESIEHNEDTGTTNDIITKSPRQKPFATPTTKELKTLNAPPPPDYHDVGIYDKNHLSISCHLFPRLSETNLQFHDISWNYEQFQDGSRRAILRKRTVKVCALLKILAMRYENRNKSVDSNASFDVTFCLVDGRPRADNQVVSNLHTAVIPLQSTRLGFLAKPICNVLVRSNYAQPDVRLRISVKRRDIFASISGDGVEQPILGNVELSLLDDAQRPVWRTNMASRSQLFGEFRMNFELCDFPNRQTQMQADYLPDVLICDGSWIGMLAFYRQIICQVISRNCENPPHSTMINDILLVTFPRILENRAIVEAFVRLLVKERLLTSSGDLITGSHPISIQNINKFRHLYHNYILPLMISTANRRSESMVQRILDLIAGTDPIIAICEQRCAPLSSADYTLHLTGSHALD